LAEALIVAAPHSSSGKTLITLALLRAFRDRGVRTAAAKVGPDYIDPRFHAVATGLPACNLDSWAMRRGLIEALLAATSRNVDLVLIEGAMGLFDGAAAGRGSTADLALQLKLPVILVIDAGRQAQSVAALVHGFTTFRPGLTVAGVVLNRVAGDRHLNVLNECLPPGLFLGAMPRLPELEIPSRHLGLTQACELADLERLIATAAERVQTCVDLDRLAALARKPALPPAEARCLAPLGQRIAIARDAAFGFSYEHLLAGWRVQGAELGFFSPLADEAPPDDADAVFLPGGYPELHGGRLAAARRFRLGLLAAQRRDALIYGECGGFMVLGARLIDANGTNHAMAGLLAHVTSFAAPKLTLGYRSLRHKSPLPFPPRLRGHEFHYSTLVSASAEESLFDAADASGAPLGSHGTCRGKVMGSYAHVIDGEDAR
jgi:cobyrinic acid a,c-diamide synthase